MAPVSARPCASRAALADPAADETSAAQCPRGPSWEVHKFGGTCLANPERIREAMRVVVEDPAENKVVVVSAMGSTPESPVKVTDLMLSMIGKAAAQDIGFMTDLTALQEKHVACAKELLGEGPELNQFLGRLMDDVGNLKSMLEAISIAALATEAFSDFVVGHGELWSALLGTAACRQMGCEAAFMDARDILVVTPTPDRVSVDVNYEASNRNLDKWYSKIGTSPAVIVATGFIARSTAGQITTLRRNGSDYSATILGALFRSSQITIWTDVDGVYSADPRKVSEAFCLGGLSYHEAWELSYFGANVLHPRTTLPAMKYSIPITIRNFFNFQAPGTKIGFLAEDSNECSVKAFSTIDDMNLISVEGTGMAGVPGIAAKIFNAMKDAEINVSMISQASSEQSICFAVRGLDGPNGVQVLREKFADELQAGIISCIDRIENCCLLAAVGRQMVNRRGTAATLMTALAKANINIIAIAQGSSEYNITVLIDQEMSGKALQAVHSRFYMSAVSIGVGLVGPGLVGGTLMDQMKEQKELLCEKYKIDIRVLALANSSKMLLHPTGIDLDNWQTEFQNKAESCDLSRLADHLSGNIVANTVILDCTASDTPPCHYLEWINKGIHIITPNKKLGAGPLDRYLDVRQSQRESYTHWYYEATVGAGLPVVATLKHLLETGDKILKIEGIFSGTLSYIFNEYKAGMRFSDIVKIAKESGFTEPDPRDDLAGMDVARKVTILARECGMHIELNEVPVQSLVPEPLQSTSSVAEFMERLPDYDEDMSNKMEAAEAAGECLRYVGTVDCEGGEGNVELRSISKTHPFAQLSGSDNIIAFTTSRYRKQPLMVRGPGAGAEVTAAGVFSDLLRLAASLGAPS
ncbi:unnamed protein product [Ostreobium quekettii]|uniref:ACT domain-containing protein n=1 Tax=Ostreobium quekettii TaxID=121088 RepID=A0A8S1J8L1_9CHLO|nr:unnamed protein product [Ostreobium quekettii]